MTFPKSSKNDFYDDERGIALIHGTLIKSDSISANRFDKVMPLWPEEHAVTAFVLEQLDWDWSQKRVLEIGCGSGVFSILCARAGAAVLAVDSSARALSATINNASQNSINACFGNKSSILGGEIRLSHEHVEFNPETHGEASIDADKYDLVIITPPYNPTFQYLQPALHAGAGTMGQDVFDQMLEPALRAMHPKSVLVCNHMDLVNKRRKRTAEEKLKKRFQKLFGGGTIERHWCLPELEFDADLFLKRQYSTLRSYLDKRDGKLSEELEDYIGRETKGQKFSLSTLQIACEEHRKVEIEVVDKKNGIAKQFDRNWDSRISLHRRIVETSAAELEQSIIADSPKSHTFRRVLPNNTQQDDTENAIGVIERLGLNPEEVLESLDQPNEIDVLIFDAAPMTETVHGKSDHSNELSIWLSKRALDKLKIEDPQTVQAINRAWQNNTAIRQNKTTGPFLHPAFTGSSAISDQPHSLVSTILVGEDGVPKSEVSNEQALFENWKQRVHHSSRPDQHDEDSPATEIHLNKSDSISNSLGLFTLELDTLNVDSPAKYLMDLVQTDRIDFLFQEYSSKRILNSIRKKCKSWRSSGDKRAALSEVFPTSSKHRTVTSQILESDLRYCHRLMHQSLLQTLQTEVFDKVALRWTSLIGAPLRISQAASNLSVSKNASMKRKDGLPFNYRGGVWVFAASFDDNPYKHAINSEADLRSTFGTTWTWCMERYSAASNQHLVDQALHDTAHQLRAHVMTMFDLISEDPDIGQDLKASAELMNILFDLHLSFDSLALRDYTMGFEQIRSLSEHAGLMKAESRLHFLNDEEFSELNQSDQAFLDNYDTAFNSFDHVSEMHSYFLKNIKADYTKFDLNIFSEYDNDPRMIGMLYSAIWQAYGHCIRYFLEGHGKPELIASLKRVGSTVRIRIQNSGYKSESRDSNDARLLSMYAERMNLPKPDGPRFNPRTKKWETTIHLNEPRRST